MSLETDIRARLQADGVVGPLVGTRIYPEILAQEATLPAIAYSWVSGQREWSLSGPTHLAHPRIQFSCFATTYFGAKDVAVAVRNCLDGYVGTLSGGTVIQGIILLDERDMFEESDRTYRRDVDFEIWYEE